MNQDTTVTEVAICITHAVCFCSWYKATSEGLVGLREEDTGHMGWVEEWCLCMMTELARIHTHSMCYY